MAEDSSANALALLGNDNFEDAGRAITAVGAAAHGTVSINGNGTASLTDDFVVYTPDADYVGADAFTYTVTSGGTSETATANITVTAVADVASDDVDGGRGLQRITTFNCSAMTVSRDPGRAITAVGAAAHGTVGINSNGTPGDATTISWSTRRTPRQLHRCRLVHLHRDIERRHRDRHRQRHRDGGERRAGVRQSGPQARSSSRTAWPW